MSSLLQEFRDFAMKGNVLDLAVGVIIGGAFGKIVSSLVSDILMPAIGLILGSIDFSTLALTIGESKIAYGMFLQSVVDFVIVAFCIFMMIKQMNRFKKPAAAPAAPEVPADIKLLTEIRDALRAK
jgi:large conductance mechanosensitive channel